MVRNALSNLSSDLYDAMGRRSLRHLREICPAAMSVTPLQQIDDTIRLT